MVLALADHPYMWYMATSRIPTYTGWWPLKFLGSENTSYDVKVNSFLRGDVLEEGLETTHKLFLPYPHLAFALPSFSNAPPFISSFMTRLPSFRVWP